MYIVWFSYIMKKMVIDPTANFYAITLAAHISSITITLIMLIIIGLFFGFGLSVICFS